MRKIIFILALLSLLILGFLGISFGVNKAPAFWLDSKIEINKYYFGKIDEATYWFQFTKTDKDLAEGNYFILTNDAYADIKAFSIKKNKRNYILNFDNTSVDLKIDANISSNGFALHCSKLKSKFLFFKKYELLGNYSFKKYIKPEFKTFPKRYKEEIFSDIKVIKDIEYGKASGYWTSYDTGSDDYLGVLLDGFLSSLFKETLSLKMDIYMPKNDNLEKRPLIMLIHGGAFYIGDKGVETMSEMCKYFSKRGYVCASINYRIGFKLAKASIERAGYRALQDAHSALRFLVKNCDTYNINPNYIFVGGSSAGGITALNLAFMRNKDRPSSSQKSFLYSDLGNIESTGNSCKDKFEIKAVINMWGAINSLDMIDNSKASVISFHGDIDDVVPIDYNYPFQDIKGGFSSILLNKTYGSLPIHIKLKENSNREYLHIFEGLGHSLNVDKNDKINKNFHIICDESKDFLYEEIVPSNWGIYSIPPILINSAMPVYETNASEIKEYYWDIEGGIIIGKNKNKIRVVWFKEAEKHVLKLSFLTDLGAGFYSEYEF
ncbi:MAG: alpha/beta hydrolase [Bacteroidales bacterium]|jgi:pimeloyl-ACP methyl ester carboxylesterase|nr:alpha/beta hydrolase [Bacteroidales bacterium]